MRRRTYLVVLVCLAVWGGGRIALAQQPLWRPYIEMEGRGTSIRTVGQGNLFLPLLQDGESLLFADLRGLWTDVHEAEGNWGLAYRRILPSDWIVGASLFYDARHTEFDNAFHQGTAGVELLNVDWGFRVNGYLPDQDVKFTPSLSGAFLQGGNIVVRPGLEAAYWGVDFEAERRLWFRDGCGCDGIGPSNLGALDAELWAAAGVFQFDNDATGFENITGPRFRTELRLYDLPLLGDGSRFVVGGQYEYDDVRGSVGSGMLTLRIPFGRGAGRNSSRLTGLNRRMVAPIVRDIDIVTNAGALGAAEPAKFVSNGQTISQALIIDANTANPELVIAGAGANSLVIANGAAGTILPGGTINMNNGQVLMGGGSGLAVVGCNTGARATFNAPGTRGAFSINAGAGVDLINAANNTRIQSVDLVTTANTSDAIRLDNDTNVLIADVGINTSGDGSDGIFSMGASQFTVSGSTITTTGNGSDGIQSEDNSLFTVINSMIVTSGNSADGIESLHNSQFTFTGGSITTTGNVTRGVRAVSDNGFTQTFLLSGVTINSRGAGVFLNGTTNNAGTINATIMGSTITSTGSEEIRAQTDGTAVQCLNIFGNTLASGAGQIRLNRIGIGSDINVTQLDPFGPADPNRLDTVNGIPAANVIIPGNLIDFNAGFCPTP